MQLAVRALLDQRPASSTRMLSALTMVESRWAMTTRGAVLRHLVERVLDLLLGVAVERARGLVEDQDRRPLEDGAGDGDALLLAAGELEAALAHHGAVALGQLGDEAVDLRHARGLAAPPRRWRRAGRSGCCRGWCR